MARKWREIYDKMPEGRQKKVDERVMEMLHWLPSEESLAEATVIEYLPPAPAAPSDKSFRISEMDAPPATGEDK